MFQTIIDEKGSQSNKIMFEDCKVKLLVKQSPQTINLRLYS